MAYVDELIAALNQNSGFGGALPSAGVSYAGGLSLPTGNDPAMNALAMENMDKTIRDIEPARKANTTKNKIGTSILNAVDIFNMIGGDKDAYIGQSLERLAANRKTESELNAEQKQADVQRATILSQRASMTEDPELKMKYGAAIKKLLPKETQGLDDLTASGFFTSNDKMQIEKLKAYAQLQKQESANANRLAVAELNNASKENIAAAKTSTQMEIAQLNNEYKKAIADGNNDRALQVAQMITDRQMQLADINNAAKLQQEELKQTSAMDRVQAQQEGANYRTGLQQSGAMDRVLAQQSGALERVQAQQAGALERAKISAAAKKAGTNVVTKEDWPSVKAKYDASTKELNGALQILNENKLFGPIQTRYLKLGGGTSEQRQLLGRVRESITQAVQAKLQQVRDAAGTGRAADTEKEAARVIGYLGDDNVSQDIIIGALKQFMYNADQKMKLKEQELFGGQAPVQQSNVISVGEVRNGYKFKGGDPRDKNNWEAI